MYKNVFIVGSPRSGTTLLGDILDLHPQIARWYEPYFVLDRYFRNSLNDYRTTADANDEVREYIANAFDYYRKKRKCDIVIDKSPRNSLKIAFLNKIFPSAKFIHILRDGRDVTLSINREWRNREEILGNRRRMFQAMRTIRNFIKRQPLLVHKVAALRFEIGSFAKALNFRSWLNRLRWEGRIAWGPRFEDWQFTIDRVSKLEFNALQWVKCTKAVLKESQNLKESRFLEIRYENLLKLPNETIKRIFDFLKVPFATDFMSQIPVLKTSSISKWRDEFSYSEKALIGPILNPLLMQFGYANNDSWYKFE